MRTSGLYLVRVSRALATVLAFGVLTAGCVMISSYVGRSDFLDGRRDPGATRTVLGASVSRDVAVPGGSVFNKIREEYGEACFAVSPPVPSILSNPSAPVVQGPVHSESTDTHYDGSDTHTAVTYIHKVTTCVHADETSLHCPATTTHTPSTATHEPTTNTHWPDTGTHTVASDIHLPTSDSHSKPTNTHFSDTGTHSPESDTHRPSSDTHFSVSSKHSSGSSTHGTSSAYHGSASETHIASSDLHSTASATVPVGAGFCNTNAVGAIGNLTLTAHSSGVQVLGQFIDGPVDADGIQVSFRPTTHERNLELDSTLPVTGQLRITTLAGDPACVNARLKSPGAAFSSPISIPDVRTVGPVDARSFFCLGNWEFGVHTLELLPSLEPGFVLLQLEFDPDPTPTCATSAPSQRIFIAAWWGPWAKLEVRYKCFIQCEAVPNPNWISPNPYHFYNGNNRWFSYGLGSNIQYDPLEGGDAVDNSKLMIEAVVDLDPLVAPPMLPGSMRRASGVAKAYPLASIYSPNIFAPCPHNISGPDIARALLILDDTNAIITSQRLPPRDGWQLTKVTIQFSVGLPLEPLSVPITANVNVFLRQKGNTVEYMVIGNHAQFPAHELYIAHSPAPGSIYHTTPGGMPSRFAVWYPTDPDDALQLVLPNVQSAARVWRSVTNW